MADAPKPTELSRTQLHMLAGILSIENHWTLTRDQIFAQIRTLNADFNPNGRLSQMPEGTLRILCHTLEIPAAGLGATEMAHRLRDQAVRHAQAENPVPEVPTAPVNNPKDIHLGPLKDLLDQVAHREWVKEIISVAKTRLIWTGVLENQRQNPPVATAPNPVQVQMLELLKAGIKKSLDPTIMNRLSPKIDSG